MCGEGGIGESVYHSSFDRGRQPVLTKEGKRDPGKRDYAMGEDRSSEA